MHTNKIRKFNNYRKKLSLFLFLLLLLTSCSNNSISNNSGNAIENSSKENVPISKSSFKLNTAVTITLYDSTDTSIIDECFELCDYYEQKFSRTIATSEIFKLNEAGTTPTKVSLETAELLKKCITYGDLSKGFFDVSIEPLSSIWDFTADTPKKPEDSLIKEAVTHVNYKNISIDNDTVTLKEDGMGIDLGGIAKGYIADRIKDFLIEKGVKSAIINLGGNILCVGSKAEGVPFSIGIQKPFATYSETIATMEISDLSVVSSGVYERFFTEDGVNYHHILDPSTGYPINNGLVAVTIISPMSADGDALSTSCFALGLEEGLKLIESKEDTYAVFITDDYELHYSKGFLENIKVTEQ